MSSNKNFFSYAAVLALVVVSIIGALLIVKSTYDDMVKIENSIDANYKSYENTYSNYFLSIKELAKVSDKYSDRFKDIYNEIMLKRYSGTESQSAMFHIIKEDNPNFSPDIFIEIQQKIASGRKEMELRENLIVDSKRVAYNNLDTLVSGFILSKFGFPKKEYGYKDGNDNYKIAQSTDTIKMKENGIKEMVEF